MACQISTIDMREIIYLVIDFSLHHIFQFSLFNFLFCRNETKNFPNFRFRKTRTSPFDQLIFRFCPPNLHTKISNNK